MPMPTHVPARRKGLDKDADAFVLLCYIVRLGANANRILAVGWAGGHARSENRHDLSVPTFRCDVGCVLPRVIRCVNTRPVRQEQLYYFGVAVGCGGDEWHRSFGVAVVHVRAVVEQ